MDRQVVKSHDVVPRPEILASGGIKGVVRHRPSGGNSVQRGQAWVDIGVGHQSEPSAVGLVEDVQRPLLVLQVGGHPEIVGIVPVNKPVVGLPGTQGQSVARPIVALDQEIPAGGTVVQEADGECGVGTRKKSPTEDIIPGKGAGRGVDTLIPLEHVPVGVAGGKVVGELGGRVGGGIHETAHITESVAGVEAIVGITVRAESLVVAGPAIGVAER